MAGSTKCPFFALGRNSNIIGKLGNFINFHRKIPDIFDQINGHFGLFKTPILRLGEAGTIQTQSQIRRLNIAKTDFKSVRKTIEAFNCSQKRIVNRLIIITPVAILMLLIIVWAKTNQSGFSLIWRYFTFFNQLIAVPTFIFSTIYLFKKSKNYLITLIPGLFYIFIITAYILNSHIGFDLNNDISKILASIITLAFLFVIKRILNKNIKY